MRTTRRIALACFIVAVIFVAATRPWLWNRCLPRLLEPLPTGPELDAPMFSTQALPPEILQLLDDIASDVSASDDSAPAVTEERRQRIVAAAERLITFLADRMAATPAGHHPPPAADNELDVFSRHKVAVRTLYEAGRIWLDAGESEKTWQAVLLIIRLGRRWAAGGAATGSMVAAASEHRGYHLALQMVAQTEPGPEQARRLVSELNALEPRPAWELVVRQEYREVKKLLLQPPGVTRIQAALLSYLGIAGECPLSVTRAVYNDALRWDRIPPHELWSRPWGPSGPAPDPKLPGISVPRRELDRLVSSHPLLGGSATVLKHALIARLRADLYEAGTLAGIAAHVYRKRTGTWPERLSDDVLQPLGLTDDHIRDPFTGDPVLWTPDAAELLRVARRLRNQVPYVSPRRIAEIRDLLTDFPKEAPLIWSPLACGDLWAKPTVTCDEFGATLLPCDLLGLRWVEEREAAAEKPAEPAREAPTATQPPAFPPPEEDADR